jgi:two-component system, sensor histidine kinase
VTAEHEVRAPPEHDSPEASIAWPQVLHDLRQPIQSALLLTDVLSSTADPRQRQRAAQHLESALLGFQAMLDALSRLTLLETGHRVPAPAPCMIADLLQDVVDQCAADQLPVDRLTLTSEPRTVSTDGKLLAVVLTTLLHTALDADQRGQIQIEGQSVGGLYSIRVRFKGAAVSVAQQHAMFAEVRHGSGLDTACSLIPGLGYVTRLGKLCGCRLNHSILTDGAQSLTLLLPGAAAPVAPD